MTSFALVTEGITDQVVIEKILHAYYADQIEDEVEIRALQPLRDATDEARQQVDSFGGWERVLEHCAFSDNLAEAIAFNDFIIIQIDTDCSEHPNFNVALAIDGVAKSVPVLVEDVKQLLIKKIGNNFAANPEKFIFAIAVHSTECWLLPLHSKTKADACRTLSCEKHLARLVKRGNGDFSKDYDCYSLLAAPFRKNKNLADARISNESLNIFVENLPYFGSGADFVPNATEA
jgi:hypothetical protein